MRVPISYPEAMGSRLSKLLEGIPKSVARVVSIVLVLGIAWVNYGSTLDLRFSLLYLVPVALASWLVGRGAGLALSVGSAALWLIQHLVESRYDPTRRIAVYVNAALLLGFFVLFSWLFSALRRALDREKEAARVDPLTGIPNRRAFLEIAESEVHRSARYGHPFTVAYLDLDNFKTINDRLGHAAGDRALQHVAEAISRGLRANDVGARLGGDEFVVLLPETSVADAHAVLERIRRRIGDAQCAEDGLVTVSVGCVTFEAPPASMDEMLKVVDRVMYSAKTAGANGLVCRVLGGSDRTERTRAGR